MRRGMIAAVVLGTALSALGSNRADAALPEETLRAVQDISRYCTACWRNARLHPDAWSDCTQDVFARLIQRVPTSAWDRVMVQEAEERREFLRAIDAVKKRTQRRHHCAALIDDAVADHRGGDVRLHDDRATVDRAAAELLSTRQQRILQLSFEGASVQEIADELSLAPERVSDEKYKAIRKLRQHLCAEERDS
ncbi:MAG: sigma-70 family RNA polymerase sigma factor [Planctomycetia bacterium]|nr:sigma-70 family RNA polymerase sigma factor [Planctomycetia bacterium]